MVGTRWKGTPRSCPNCVKDTGDRGRVDGNGWHALHYDVIGLATPRYLYFLLNPISTSDRIKHRKKKEKKNKQSINIITLTKAEKWLRYICMMKEGERLCRFPRAKNTSNESPQLLPVDTVLLL